MASDKDNPTFAELYEQTSGSAPRHKRMTVGEEVEVIIAKVTKETAFADLDGKREAFIDLAELTDSAGTRIAVAPGMKVRARVAEVGSAVRLVPLAIKHLGADEEQPPEQVGLVGKGEVQLATGQRMRGTVVRMEAYGVFIQLDGTTGRNGRGLLPMAETGLPRGTDPRKQFAMGQSVEVKIVAIDDTGRIRLSTKALAADDEQAEFKQFSKQADQPEGKRSFGTLGDLLARSKEKPRKR